MAEKTEKTADNLRYGIALDMKEKTQEERTTHIYTMLAAKKLLSLGEYISPEQDAAIQKKIDEAIHKYKIKIDQKAQHRIRIISLPFE